MHRKPVFAANWKLNLTPTDARAFLQRFLALTPRQQDRTIILCPSAMTASTVADALRDRPDIWVGVQNVHSEAQGAFTGENSVLMVRDIGARVVLVGHSERRHVFGETDEMTTKKCALVANARLIPILCVGETLSERESGATASVVERQLAAGIAEMDDVQVGAMMLAYEPVWAIGTGKTATPEDASDIHGVLRRALTGRVGEKAAQAVPILYGGSVNRGNASTLLASTDVDGLLVGGASLDPDGWSSITRS
ncbi:MAG: triose-phosphate isomerase [Gemmatimonadaceae bacterium]|nr:triose-phosphate isomerase [Gemmatimonadaceae bacterium]